MRLGLCRHQHRLQGLRTVPDLRPGAAAAEEKTPGAGPARPLCLVQPPPLLTMGTLGCNPAPRLTTECQSVQTGLRKSCGTATSENGTHQPWGREAMVVGSRPLFSPAVLGLLEYSGSHLEGGRL